MSEPTYNYKGYEMRSIAEARWAAFFDICGIKWQYEPLNTGSYIPDFLLFGRRPLVVEIKGGATTLEQIKEQTAYVPEALLGHSEADILCIGASPFIGSSDLFGRDDVVVGVIYGYQKPLPEYEGSERETMSSACYWDDSAVATSCEWSSECGDGIRYGFCDEYGDYTNRPHGCHHGNIEEWTRQDIEAKWAEACNRVKYRFGGSA